MKQIRLFNITLLLSLIILIFPSCSEYYWEDASLLYTIRTSSYPSSGIVDDSDDISIDRVEVYGNRPISNADIVNLNHIDGNIRIGLRSDERAKLSLWLPQSDYFLPLAEARGSVTNFNDRKAQDFLAEMAYLISKYGYAEVVVEGETLNYGNSPVDIEIYIDLKAEIRE